MENQEIKVLEKLKKLNGVKNEVEATSCCGGTPVSNEDACCKLDEDKKLANEVGCGCSASAPTVKSSCS